MNIEETETLAFTYDRPFHMLQRHSNLSINQTESFGKMWQREIVYSTLVNDGTLRSTADFASTLNNANNVKISDLFEFTRMLLFSSHCFHPKTICKKLQYYGKIHGGDSLLIT